MADRLDLDAIAADDALLDLLAAGGESAWEAGEHDPALKLLADLRIAVEVEDELPVETIDDPETFLARCAALNPVTDPLARKIAARGLALGVAAVAALSVSGVAAAVTGNPLEPYEKVIEKVVDQLRPQTSFPKDQKLDSMAPVDRTKLVKVVKDYREQQQKQQAELTRRLNPALVEPPQDQMLDPRPPLARPTPEMPITLEKQVVEPTPESTPKPTAQPAETPPPDTPTTPPDTPTPPPTTETPTPTPTDTSTEATPGTPTDPVAVPDEADPGSNDHEEPASEPQSDSPEGQPGTDSQATASEGSKPGDQNTPTGSPTQSGDDTTPTGSPTRSGDDTTPTGSPTQSGDDTTVPGDQSRPSDEQTKQTEPSRTGRSSTEEPRAESSEKASHKSSAKHSNGKHKLGYANGKYATGKHSSGHYAEGKHAALSRAHGSMAPKTLRQILVVVNGVMEQARTD